MNPEYYSKKEIWCQLHCLYLLLKGNLEKTPQKLYNIFGDDALEIFEEENKTNIKETYEKGVQKNTGQSGSRIVYKIVE